MLLLKFTPLAERYQNPKWRPQTISEWSAFIDSIDIPAHYPAWTSFQDPIYPPKMPEIKLSPEFMAKLKAAVSQIKITTIRPEIPREQFETNDGYLKPMPLLDQHYYYAGKSSYQSKYQFLFTAPIYDPRR